MENNCGIICGAPLRTCSSPTHQSTSIQHNGNPSCIRTSCPGLNFNEAHSATQLHLTFEFLNPNNACVSLSAQLTGITIKNNEAKHSHIIQVYFSIWTLYILHTQQRALCIVLIWDNALQFMSLFLKCYRRTGVQCLLLGL